MRTTQTLAEVAGANAREIRRRAGVTLEQVAKAARYHGLPWTTGRVGSFESGRVGAKLETLVLVAQVLGVVTGERVSLADLFARDPADGDGRAVMNDVITMDLELLRGVLSGDPVQLPIKSVAGARERLASTHAAMEADFASWHPTLRRVNLGLRQKVYADFSEADYKLAKSLGVSNPVHAAAAMAKQWGMTFVAKRDELAGPDANQQKRGRVSRELKAELRKVLDGES